MLQVESQPQLVHPHIMQLHGKACEPAQKTLQQHQQQQQRQQQGQRNDLLLLRKPANGNTSGQVVSSLQRDVISARTACFGKKAPPRVAIVARRYSRKNKFVDFVGEYHLDLLVQFGAAPIIVPRVDGMAAMLAALEPIHGVLLCEGEDVQPACYEHNCTEVQPDVVDEATLDRIRESHPSDTDYDPSKDDVELALVCRCLEKGIPFFGICRGGQMLNVAMGGTLWVDVETFNHGSVRHIDYDNYDGHRHNITVVKDTPLFEWFGKREVLSVNSYHHQGYKKLAPGLKPMAHSDDGLIEGMYDAEWYDPPAGKFRVGLQFHPERMQEDGKFDYDGCPVPYEKFCEAVRAYAAATAL
eukprot:TRINITY_DN4360_c0_g1_i3.p1 TRINITY_DN4360_c0_g1~~TRINITY_DN4360_c0_g1_i3.p1  ORF type:complete len:356 (-),score=77.93 TRINITY_DN4360_c0_g1_i3:648-1715(-)